MTDNENDNAVPLTDRFMTKRQLADYFKIDESELGNWRCPKIGPGGIKIEDTIRYRKSDVDAWVAANTVDPSE